MGHDMGLKMLCRFSSDQYSIDDSLPFIANILLANVFMLSGIAIVLCYVQVKHPYCNDRPPFTFHIWCQMMDGLMNFCCSWKICCFFLFFCGLTKITFLFVFAVDFFSGDAAYILLLLDSTGLFFQNLCNWQTSIFVKGTHQSLLLESSCGASSIIPFPSCQTEHGFSLCDDQWPDLLALAMQAMQRYYRATSRELRRLDSVSRSHVYTTFTEVLDGSGTIRAFKAQVETLSPVPPKLSSSPKKVNPHTMIITLGKTTLYQLTRRNPNL